MSKYTGTDISLIEAKAPEEITLRSEEVMDTGQVSGLIEEKSGHWQSIVVDNNMHFSVMVEVKSEKLQRCKCNCKDYARESICAHILVTIIDIRKLINDRKEAVSKKKKKTRSSRPKTPQLGNLLSKLSREEIESFIISKSRSDRNFKLLLQGRFIEKMSSDELAPFIESTFPVLTKANEKIAASKLKIFLDITEELVNHFKNLIAQDDLIEAYHLAFLLLKKSFYIKYHLKSEHASFYRLHKNLLSNYIEVYKLIEAPEYKEGINTQLRDLLKASYISASLKEEKDLWMLFYNVGESSLDLIEIVSLYLNRTSTSDYNSWYFIKMLEVILESDPAQQAALISGKDMQECYRIIQYLKDFSDSRGCHEAMHLFYMHKSLNHPLAKMIIESIEVSESSKAAIIDQTIQYFLKYKDSAYIQFLKDTDTKWAKTKQQVINLILEKNEPSLLIKLHLECNDHSAAISSLRAYLSWGLLRQYDTDIIEEDAGTCRELYEVMLIDYLKEHFGVKAQDFTRQVFQRIIAIGYKKWLPDLKKAVLQAFPERKSTIII